MLSLIAPQSYIRGSGVLRKFSQYTQKLGHHYLILSGKAAWSVVSDVILDQIQDSKDTYHLELMEGFPTHQKVDAYTTLTCQKQLDLIIGIGAVEFWIWQKLLRIRHICNHHHSNSSGDLCSFINSLFR